jgi:PAS domain S-box-containing protein
MTGRPALPLDQVLMRLVRSRLFIPLLVVSLAAIAVAGMMSVQVLEDRQREDVQSRAAVTDRYLDQADRMLGAVVRVAGVSSKEEIRTSMQATYDAYGYFDTLYLLDTRSRIVLMVPPDPRYLDVDMSGMPADALTGPGNGSRISRPFISLRTGEPTVSVAQDLPSGGFVVGELSLDALRQEISASSGAPPGDFVFLMDQYGTLIAHPSHDLVLQQTNMGDLGIFRQGTSGPTTQFYPYEGSLVLGSAVRVDRTGWVVVDQVPVLAAFGTYLLILGLTFVVLTGIWLVVAWNLGARLRSEIVVPLEHLGRGVSAMTAGDFSLGDRALPSPGAYAELDRLTDDFRQMSDTIRERQRALEHNREELVQKNEDLNTAYEHLAASEEELREQFDELKVAEEQLKLSEQRFLDIISHLPDGTFAIDLEGRVIAWNRALEEATGVAADDVIGKTEREYSVPIYGERRPLLIDFVIRPDADLLLAYYPEARRVEDKLYSERFIQNLNGGTGAEVWMIASPLYDTAGRVIGAIESVRDVTERTRAEEAVKKSEREWQATFNAIADPIFLLDDRRRIVRHNRALETYLNRPADEIDGRHCYEIMHAPSSPPKDCPFERAKDSRVHESLELKLGDRWCIASVDPVLTEDGALAGAVHLLIDITDRKRTEDALGQARRKLNMLNAILFSDIQNCIFSLAGYLELQKTTMETEPSHRYTEREIGLVRTISDSLSYAKIFQSLGLNAPGWQHVGQTFLMAISHLDLSNLSRRLEVGDLEMYADAMLENVFYALADNTLEHAKTATAYSLTYMETPDGLVLVFEDNGPGIPEVMKEKVFEREFGRRQGIGLFLCSEILSITGITIRETGEPGTGARFEIVVPRGMYRSGSP